MPQTADSMAIAMVFLRVGWMNRYDGIRRGDTISGGGAFVAEHGFGHEIFNFRPFKGAMYGYVQPPGRRGRWDEGKIMIARLGAAKGMEAMPGVLAIWVATAPSGGSFIVGWYKNATVYRSQQPAPTGSNRWYAGDSAGYYVTAGEDDAVRLPAEARLFAVPQTGKGAFGQANIWYADRPAEHRRFRADVLQYIASRKPPHVRPDNSSSGVHPDPLVRQRIERAAVDATVAHFTELGYRVDSVERDNVGWDLNASTAGRALKLEVKGLAGSRIAIELTPNEYRAMRDHAASYCFCVVTNAVTAPLLTIFSLSPDSERWESREGQHLKFEERTGVRGSAG